MTKIISAREDIIDMLSTQSEVREVDIINYPINIKAVHMISSSMARKYKSIPIDMIDDKLIIAMTDPLDLYAKDDIKLFTKMNLEILLSSENKIINIIDKYFSNESSKKILEEFTEYKTIDEDLENNDLMQQMEVASAPVVRLLNSIIEQAIKDNASDIHIEPFLDYIRVRVRIDGDLIEIMTLSKNNFSPIITRIKIMGKMNIAENRIPQDGRIDINMLGRQIDMRISMIPTVYGEKTVIRLLDKSRFKYSKENLGLNDKNLKKFNTIISKPYGIILVTGPTGSGKTTTLYSILKELNKTEKNIITIEDPVEYKIEGINQIQVNAKTGMNFSSSLRSILRQDPDIIMIGEIRDIETAEIAVRASITGHLVISTLHTNDSTSTIARLIDMGIEHYLVSSSAIGIISQRLLKVLCNDCKISYRANDDEKQILQISSHEDVMLYKANGCNYCNAGYKGRKAIHEIMIMNDNIRSAISQSINIDNIRDEALKNDMTTLFEGAKNLVLNGETSMSEALKIKITD